MPYDVLTDASNCPSPHSVQNKVGRVLWSCTWWLLFRPSPRVAHGWRRFLLRLFGARIGKQAKVDPSCRIWVPWNLEIGDEASVSHHVDCYNLALISIGPHATVSQYAFLCTGTHDISDPHMRLESRPICIESQAWVCAAAFVGPGVLVRTGAVIAARAVQVRDTEPWAVYAGNPARRIKSRTIER
jgi:putative colanic acid biosynthesis acetyltransferase WcaF